MNPHNVESDTPRVDAVLEPPLSLPSAMGSVPADFARQLERELNEAKRSDLDCRQILDTYSNQEGTLIALTKNYDALQFRLSELEKIAEGMKKCLESWHNKEGIQLDDDMETLTAYNQWKKRNQ